MVDTIAACSIYLAVIYLTSVVLTNIKTVVRKWLSSNEK